jgi:hypothetical protein
MLTRAAAVMTKENADGKEEGVLIYYHNFSDFTADNDE